MYGQQAFQNYSPPRAFFMTADRLLRCGRDLYNYFPVTIDGKTRFNDPISEESSTSNRFKPGDVPMLDGTNPKVVSVSDASTDGLHATDGTHDSLLFVFATQLQSEGDYYRAITEYRRLLFYYPTSQYRSSAQQSLLRCYYEAGMYESAIRYGENILLDVTNAESDEIRFYLGAAGFRATDYTTSHSHFGQLATGAGVFRDKAIMAQALTYANELNWTAAQQLFESVEGESEYSQKANYCAGLCRDGANLNYRKPSIAGILAIVPGLGYLYDGYYQTAFSALITNGLFIWGTYEAFRQDHPGLGVTLAMLEFGWYAGNIYGSISSATRRNIKMQQDLLLRFDVGFEF
jgi:tetratricopeptide (TPR) repeat protein